MPGHTAPQTSVHVPEEGVVFTGDNVFYKCRSWLQECDPWEWLTALKSIEALDVETIIPGHGDPCTKAYLKEQGQIVENWVGYIERFVDRGLTPEEILKEPTRGHQAGPLPDRPAPLHPRREADRHDRPQPAPAPSREETAANRLRALTMAQQEWTMLGEYMESCNCDYLCPCVYTNPQGPVTYDHCTAALVFRIDAGSYGEHQARRVEISRW